MRLLFLGDLVGRAGRTAAIEALPRLRAEWKLDFVAVNAENAAAGFGLTAAIADKIFAAGVDCITLGDHAFRDGRISSVLERPDEPIARPANLSRKAIGRRLTRLPPRGNRTKSLFVMTVLGRVFFPLPADDPFATVDRLLEELPEADHPLVIVEAHMEATSEKAALAYHLDGRVAAVVGSHTHVPTADARVLRGGTGFITDIGMCGPYDSIIGRQTKSTLRQMTTGMSGRPEVGSGGEALCGVVIKVDQDTGLTLHIEGVRYAAEPDRPPFG